jgi:tripartite-type tricarboxylate transporter receptor subunit TctC
MKTLLTLLSLTASLCLAQAKPISLIVPYPAGGPLDSVARAVAAQIKLGSPVIVENKPGAGGNIGAALVAKAAPDGQTLLIGAVATHAINPWLFANMPYDALKDFTPITLLAQVPNVLVMSVERAKVLNIANTADLIRYATANPNKLNYASGGNGSAGHLSGERFKQLAAVSAVHVPYQGAAPAQASLLGGQTDFMFDNLASATAQLKSGRLLALAVTTAERSSYLPEVPTLQEAKLANFNISTWFGIFAPANFAQTEATHAAIQAALKTPEVSARLTALQIQTPSLSPAQFKQFVQREHADYGLLIQSNQIKLD